MKKTITLLRELMNLETSIRKRTKKELEKAFDKLSDEGISPMDYSFLYQISEDLEYWEE